MGIGCLSIGKASFLAVVTTSDDDIKKTAINLNMNLFIHIQINRRFYVFLHLLEIILHL